MYSNDGGETWEDHRPGAVKDAHELAWHPSDSIRAYEVGGGGAAWSFDGGKAWKPSNMGRDRHYVWALAVDPSDPDIWFISATYHAGNAHSGTFHGNHGADAYVYRSQGEGP